MKRIIVFQQSERIGTNEKEKEKTHQIAYKQSQGSSVTGFTLFFSAVSYN